MDHIVSQIMEILSEEASILERENSLNHFLEHLVCELVARALERLDEAKAIEMRAQGYQIEKRPSRSVNFFFGNVVFRRRSYVKGEERVYGIDELLGLSSKSRQSRYVQNVFAQASTLGVFRKVSETIGLVSPLSISHQQLQQLARQVGEEIDANQSQDLRNNPANGQRKVKVLYVEGDAFCVGKQGGGQLYIHRFQVCEGRRKVGKHRRLLEGYHEFIDLSREKALEQLADYLGKTYDLSETLLVTNSDGGAGYQKSTFASLCGQGMRQEHFVDRSHVTQKIKQRLRRTPELVKDFQEALSHYDKDLLVPFYDTLEGLYDSAEAQEDLQLLRAYLERNWAFLKPFHQRESLRGLEPVIGTCESNHRAFTYRMKKQGRRWSEAGAQAMIKLLSARRNQEFDLYSGYSPLPEEEEIAYNWQELYRSYQKTASETKALSHRDYSQVSQAHLTSHRLRMGFNI